MAIQITLKSLTSRPLSLDISLPGEDRAIRAKLAPHGSKLLSGVTLAELDANPELQKFIDSGDLKLELVNGPVEVYNQEFRFDEANPTFGEHDILASAPHDYELLDVHAHILLATIAGRNFTVYGTTEGAMSSSFDMEQQIRVRDNHYFNGDNYKVYKGDRLWCLANDSVGGGRLRVWLQRLS